MELSAMDDCSISIRVGGDISEYIAAKKILPSPIPHPREHPYSVDMRTGKVSYSSVYFYRGCYIELLRCKYCYDAEVYFPYVWAVDNLDGDDGDPYAAGDRVLLSVIDDGIQGKDFDLVLEDTVSEIDSALTIQKYFTTYQEALKYQASCRAPSHVIRIFSGNQTKIRSEKEREYQKKYSKKYGKRNPRGTLQRSWANLVKHRDKCCVMCGDDNNLEAHHVKPYKTCIDGRWDVNNGITLCGCCHKKQHAVRG